MSLLVDPASRVVLGAGMDIDCGQYLAHNLAQALKDGIVPLSSVDAALTHLFMVQFRLGKSAVFHHPRLRTEWCFRHV